MNVLPTTMTGRVVRLEPLTEDHAAGLMAVATPELFVLSPQKPTPWTVEGMRAEMRAVLGLPDCVAFAAILRDTGAPVGRTTYMDIRPAHRGLEIGRTWIAASHWGTPVNPEMKFLMLRHAFETLGALRVQLKTDARNVHSQRAIAKLGAVNEGVLRKHMILPDGFVRDTVLFSITDEEWPAVKAGLVARLGYEP
jgi:RimJ/RimL family protein N-acetyltransferase